MVDRTVGLDLDLVKALAHPVRIRVLEALQGRVASPIELSQELGESVGVVSHHVAVLRDLACVEQVRTRPRRGTIEHFYTANLRSFIGDQDWRRAPLSLRGGVTNEALRTFGAKIAAAIDAGKLDSRDDTTLNWMPAIVDERGWTEIAEVLDRARHQVMDVAAAGRERLADSDGIPVVTGLAAFEAAVPQDPWGLGVALGPWKSFRPAWTAVALAQPPRLRPPRRRRGGRSSGAPLLPGSRS